MNYARLMQTQLGARAHETAEEKAVICLANVYVIKEVRLHQNGKYPLLDSHTDAEASEGDSMRKTMFHDVLPYLYVIHATLKAGW